MISVTRTYFTSYEDMIAYEKKFDEEHPDIAERREKGLKKMHEEMIRGLPSTTIKGVTNEQSSET